MFCRIEFLKRQERQAPTAVGIAFQGAADMTQIEAFAAGRCAEKGAHGYRISDMRSGVLKETWT